LSQTLSMDGDDLASGGRRESTRMSRSNMYRRFEVPGQTHKVPEPRKDFQGTHLYSKWALVCNFVMIKRVTNHDCGNFGIVIRGRGQTSRN
jgi:hypothetical protein